MKVSEIKSQKPFKSVRWNNLDIITYGEDNIFPQSVSEIMQASSTGSTCLNIYSDFLYGHGFKDKELSEIVVNSDNESLDTMLDAVSADYAKYGGCCIHVNYNLNYHISALNYIPFENARLSIPKKFTKGPDKIVTHPSWDSKLNILGGFNHSLVEYFDIFNPDPYVIENQVIEAGGWDKYKGQIIYFANGKVNAKNYPVPSYISEITDMRTEEGLANITGRNVCSNFMLAGMLVDILEGDDQDKAQETEKLRQLQAFQGDKAALQLWYTTAKSKEEIPAFVSFSGQNYDKAFSVTQTVVPDNIGRIFKIPPILRAVDVGANFGADLVSNSYKFYNSVTVKERTQLQKLFETILDYWWVELPIIDCSIEVLIYGGGDSLYDQFGTSGMTQIQGIIETTSLTRVQKQNLLKIGFGLSEMEVLKLLPIVNIETSGNVNTELIQALGVGGLQALTEILSNEGNSYSTKITILTEVFGFPEESAKKLAGADVESIETQE